MKFKSLRGVDDILPSQIKAWHFIEDGAKKLFHIYGYKEIRLPIIEPSQLFVRSIGEYTDIVEKEMYSFKDLKSREITLRPEGTASVVRAYIEHNLGKDKELKKLFYSGPMFRYERPQAGRKRQFYHLGVEAIGSENPAIDFEVISLAHHLFKEIGISNIEFRINSIGCARCRPSYRDELMAYFKSKLKGLCPDCNRRYEKNPLRILDCKSENCITFIGKAPVSSKYLCNGCKEHFDEVKHYLSSLDINVVYDDKLVGGRYDDLIEELGGQSTPAIGFAIGMERAVLAFESESKVKLADDSPEVFVISADDIGKEKGIRILVELRENGIYGEFDFRAGSLKSQMRLANKTNAKIVLIVGESEVKSNEVVIKNMDSGEQESVPDNKFIDKIKETL